LISACSSPLSASPSAESSVGTAFTATRRSPYVAVKTEPYDPRPICSPSLRSDGHAAAIAIP